MIREPFMVTIPITKYVYLIPAERLAMLHGYRSTVNQTNSQRPVEAERFVGWLGCWKFPIIQPMHLRWLHIPAHTTRTAAMSQLGFAGWDCP